MIRGLAVTHGDLGAELVRNVRLILGPVEGLDSMTNQGLSANDLIRAIKEWLDSSRKQSDDGIVLFVDDYGGSCANAAMMACPEDTRTVILSGVNLAMLLGFAAWRQSLGLAELAQKLVEKGREAIARVGPIGRD